MILRACIFLLLCLLSDVAFAQTKQKRPTNSKQTNSKQKQVTQPKNNAESNSATTTTQNQSTTKPKETKNLENAVDFTYLPKDEKALRFKDKLIIRTKAYKVNLKAYNKPIPSLKLYMFFEVEINSPDFEKTADGKFIIKKEQEYFYIDFLNKSDPNLTFDSPNDRLLWFNTDNTRLTIGTIEQLPIANFDVRKSYFAPMETVGSLLAKEGEITELLYDLESAKKILKLTDSQIVVGHLGSLEFELTDLHKSVLKEFANKPDVQLILIFES